MDCSLSSSAPNALKSSRMGSSFWSTEPTSTLRPSLGATVVPKSLPRLRLWSCPPQTGKPFESRTSPSRAHLARCFSVGVQDLVGATDRKILEFDALHPSFSVQLP